MDLVWTGSETSALQPGPGEANSVSSPERQEVLEKGPPQRVCLRAGAGPEQGHFTTQQLHQGDCFLGDCLDSSAVCPDRP
jgi:hypothetical protein